MPAGAIWNTAEETALVDFLVDNQSECGDGGNFKAATFQRLVAHIAQFHSRGPPKMVKSAQNKWATFRKLYHVVRDIKDVSGWVWDDTTGASINEDTASSWDDYVKKHPQAKVFRNKGWRYFHQVASLMPSTVSGANVFRPTTTGVPSHSSPAAPPRTESPAPDSESQTSRQDSVVESVEDESGSDKTPPASILPSRKRVRNPATPTKPAPKRTRASGAAALESMSASIVGFSNVMAAALAPPPSSSVLNPSPIRMSSAIEAAMQLESGWLNVNQQVAFVEFLRKDRTAPDAYRAMSANPDVRKGWVHAQLEALGISFEEK